MSLAGEIQYTDEVGQVIKVEMGVLSPERILEQSVCEVYNHITSPDSTVGTLFDARMGTSSRNPINALSDLNMMYDPGHFGHINLAKPVIQYQYLGQIITTLNSVCNRCSALLVEKTLENIQKLKAKSKKARFALIDKIKEKGCPNCGACVVKFSKDKEGVGRIMMKKTVLTIAGNVDACVKAAGDEAPVVEGEEVEEAPVAPKPGPKKKGKKKKDDEPKKKEIKSFVDPEVALEILKNITDEDVELMGYNPKLCRPDWFIWTVMPVPPPSMRPAVQTESGQTSDDDLTHKLNDIIKTNNQIRNLLQENDPDKVKYINHWWQLLQYHVATYVDNEISNVPKAVNRSGRAYKTIRQRIKAKEGRIRGNLMGKRVDGSARTVITPDPNLSIDELGVPIEILTNLTFPEVVTPYNIKELTVLVRNGPKWPGAKCIKYNNISGVEQKIGRCSGSKRYRCVLKLFTQEQRNKIVLRPGDIVYRHLMEGDWVLFNRQPSLHKMSMMGHRVRARYAKSFGLHPNVTQPYAADFDGDEMNMHTARSLQSQYEIRKLCAVPTQIVSPQASKPVMGLVQDSLLGMYRITNDQRLDYKPVNLMHLMQIIGWTNSYTGRLVQSTGFDDNGHPVWDGTALVSSYFPKISYRKFDDDNKLQIQDGKLRHGGYFTKNSFGAKAGSVIHLTWNDYGPEATRHLFDNTTKMAMQWLLIDGFSVGLKDTYIPQQDHRIISEKVNEKVIEAKLKIDFLHRGWYPILGEDLQTRFNNQLKLALGVNELPEDPERFLDTGKSVAEQFEIDIYTVLDRARSIAEKATYKTLLKEAEKERRSNRMSSMVDSGSKGTETNLVQIVSLLGQQGIDGGRVPENFYRRTLPHFNKDDLTPEAKGFIDNSYGEGLTPTQYIFHAQAGRIGVISTSIKTAETGYLQRRLMKIMEDAQVKYDGTVRNANDMILEYSYGQDGFDGAKIEPQRFDYLDVTHTEFQRTYQYMPDEDLRGMLSENAYNETVGIDNWQEVLTDEFAKINIDREKLRKLFGTNIPEKIYSPVNFRRMVKNYQYRFHLLDRQVADISPVYIVQKVQELVGELVGEIEILNGEDDFIILFALIRSHLASKKLIMEKYDRDSFNFLLGEIRKHYYQALITPGEMVGPIAAQSIGEPTTQLCHHKDERVLVILEGEKQPVYSGKIGNFIDKLMEDNSNKVVNVKTSCCANGSSCTQVLDLNKTYWVASITKTEKIEWQKLTQVSRHHAHGELVRVKTRSGRVTTATKAHSFFIRTENSIAPIQGGKLKLGDRIPVTKNLPVVPYVVNEIKITDHVKIIQSHYELLANDTIFHKGTKIVIPNKVVLDEAFGWFVGAYLAEGSVNGTEISITNLSKPFRTKTKYIATRFGLQSKEKIEQKLMKDNREFTTCSTVIASSMLGSLLKKTCGNGSYNKKVPSFAFSADQKFISALLKGYFDGDGNVNPKRHQIRCASRSDQLLEGLAILLNYVGIFCSQTVEMKTANPIPMYCLQISSKYAETFLDKIGTDLDYKKKDLQLIVDYLNRSDKHALREDIDKIPKLGKIIANVGNKLELPGQSRNYGRWKKKESIGRRTLQKYVDLFSVESKKKPNIDIKNELDILTQAANGNVVWDEIVSLETIDDPKEYVYDFTVPGTESFMLMSGIIAHNTLNVFHSTGIGSGANVSRGVPRLKEILRVAQTLATPSLEVHIDQEYLKGGLDLSQLDKSKQAAYHRAEVLAAKIEYTVLKDLVNNIQILFDANDCPSEVTGDRAFIDSYYENMPPEDNCLPNTSSPWLLRIHFREDILYKKGITMLDIETALRTNNDKLKGIMDLRCIFSDDNAEQLICRIRVEEGILNNENPVNVMRLLERLILDTKITGIDNLNTARVGLIEPYRVMKEDGTIGNSFNYVIYTDGVNLSQVFNEPYVDYTKTLSNHIIEVLEVLGIEAAREMIIKEITDILTFAGSYVNPRHIELLADIMTREGYLISIDRHGINKGDSGPWARASFEETTNQLFGAAMYGETDPMTGVSANIMFGQPFKGGTNSYAVGLDEAMLESVQIPKQKTEYGEMKAPTKVTETVDYCDIGEEDHFTFQI